MKSLIVEVPGCTRHAVRTEDNNLMLTLERIEGDEVSGFNR